MSKMLIMGNGPSLKNVRFNDLKVDTFGMNNAYKYYDEMNWYPTYWGCFDKAMTYNSNNAVLHLDFFRKGKCKEYYTLNGNAKGIDKVNFIDLKIWNRRGAIRKHSKSEPFLNVGHTAANCVQVSILKGYTEIILIGIDGDFKIFDGVVKERSGQLRLTKEMKDNPNYGWDSYQEKNEVFNPENKERLIMPTWKHLSGWAGDNGIKVINCSENSIVRDLFEYKSLEDAGVYNG